MPVMRLLRDLLAALLAAAFAFAPAAWAGTRTAKLLVPMTCPASDPPLFEQLMLNLPGVSAAKASYDDQSVTVTFDDAQSSADDMLAAFDGIGVEGEVIEDAPAGE
jgi:hypothetical protein